MPNESVQRGVREILHLSKALDIDVPTGFNVQSACTCMREYHAAKGEYWTMSNDEVARRVRDTSTDALHLERAAAMLFATQHADTLDEANRMLHLALEAMDRDLITYEEPEANS